MKRNRRWLFLALAVAMVLAGRFFVYRAVRSEPNYKGHTVAYWFEHPPPDGAYFAAMGSNAAPYLVSQLAYHDTPWDRFFCANFHRLPLWCQERLGKPLTAVEKRAKALIFLQTMGPSARMAVPKLAELALGTNETNRIVRFLIAEALCRIDQLAEAILPYCMADGERDEGGRWAGMSHLPEYLPESKAAVPALIQTLAHDKNERLRA